MRKSAGFAAGLMAALVGLSAQRAEAQLSTDRPKFTMPTATVPDGRFQLEAGYTYTTVGDAIGHQIGEALFRMGLIPGLELRAQLPSYQKSSDDVGPFQFDASGWSDPSVAMKLGLYESGMSEGIPSLSLLLGSSIPLGDDDFGADGWEPEAIAALGWSLAPRFDLGANVKFAQRDPDVGDRYSELAASIALGFPLTSRLAGFGEYFAIRPDLDGARDEDYIDGGITFLVTPDLQLDARIGVGVGDTEDAMFIGVGFGKLF